MEAATLQSILIVIVIGFIIGLIAQLIAGGPGGFLATVVLGIGGALLASWAGGRFGLYVPGEYGGWISAIIGAVVLVVIWRIIAGARM